MEDGDDKKLYFILETKGTSFDLALNPSERLKYHCDKAHFKALDPEIKTNVASKWIEVGV